MKQLDQEHFRRGAVDSNSDIETHIQIRTHFYSIVSLIWESGETNTDNPQAQIASQITVMTTQATEEQRQKWYQTMRETVLDVHQTLDRILLPKDDDNQVLSFLQHHKQGCNSIADLWSLCVKWIREVNEIVRDAENQDYIVS
ncbi:hypothetical protein PM082_022914 [Marasmius tenuissimus]|nr:hypothetical protein PM082_022914 [Marasmius tenuissimus]